MCGGRAGAWSVPKGCAEGRSGVRSSQFTAIYLAEAETKLVSHALAALFIHGEMGSERDWFDLFRVGW